MEGFQMCDLKLQIDRRAEPTTPVGDSLLLMSEAVNSIATIFPVQPQTFSRVAHDPEVRFGREPSDRPMAEAAASGPGSVFMDAPWVATLPRSTRISGD